ncbi:MAG: M28 family peptidase [Oscillospiraceae bacterium]
MAIDFTNTLNLLACKDADERRSAMEEALHRARLPYTVQDEPPNKKKLRFAKNFLVKIGDKDLPCVLFCAHYDAMQGSFGANDNAAAVSVLLRLAQSLQESGATAEFAFFDAEESGRAGSKLYVKELLKGSVNAVINLDLCGYGDTIALLDKGHNKKRALQQYCNKEILAKHNAQSVKYLPESDDVSFRNAQIPYTSIAVVPRWDIQYLNALSTYGGAFFGARTPEFDMIMGQLEVVSTMHGGYRDTIESIQPSAMQQIYDFLLDAFTEEPKAKHKWFAK